MIRKFQLNPIGQLPENVPDLFLCSLENLDDNPLPMLTRHRSSFYSRSIVP